MPLAVSVISVLSAGRQQAAVDLSGYRQRLVALEIMYIGWHFRGFASQDNTADTVEVSGHYHNR